MERAPKAHRKGDSGPGEGAGRITGCFGRPFIDLSPLIDVSGFEALHDEICLALAQVPLTYTGGSHRSMGIMPPERRAEALVDYQEVIGKLTDGEFAQFQSLSDEAEAPSDRRGRVYGEERKWPLSRRQMLWLKVRFGVYFPWKGYLELMPNDRWENKADPAGKAFTRTALMLFPKTIAFIKSLPFSTIGRTTLMGLEGFDYGTVHRDGELGAPPDPFITFCPARNKTLFLYDAVTGEERDVLAPIYWFNDGDYHGVRAAPYFRYSIRVDGPFKEEFLDQVRAIPCAAATNS